VIDTKMHSGFRFEIFDLYKEQRVTFDCPRDLYDMLMFIGAPARYVVHQVESPTLGEPAAATSTQRLSLIAGKYVGKDDPVMIVRWSNETGMIGAWCEPRMHPATVYGKVNGSSTSPTAGRPD
jgi:fructose 1,6-bisphosphate aldolase/phosphatase